MDYPSYASTDKNFLVDIIDYCQPDSIDKVTIFNPSSLVFTIGEDTQLFSTFDTQWTTVPSECIIRYELTVKSKPTHLVDPNVEDPNLIAFNPPVSDPSTV